MLSLASIDLDSSLKNSSLIYMVNIQLSLEIIFYMDIRDIDVIGISKECFLRI